MNISGLTETNPDRTSEQEHRQNPRILSEPQNTVRTPELPQNHRCSAGPGLCKSLWTPQVQQVVLLSTGQNLRLLLMVRPAPGSLCERKAPNTASYQLNKQKPVQKQEPGPGSDPEPDPEPKSIQKQIQVVGAAFRLFVVEYQM